MKSLLGKIILALTLVFTSMNACFPNDIDCFEDDHSSVKTESTSASKKANSTKKLLSQSSQSEEQKEANRSQNEGHHCLCSLSCHNLFVQSFETKELSSQFLFGKSVFPHPDFFYPKITISLEKPPTV